MKKLLSSLDEGTRKLVLIFLRILIIAVVIIILLAIFSGCGNKGNNYAKLENAIENGARNYYVSHENELPTIDGESKKISVSDLVSSNYMKSTSSYVTDSTCDGYAVVTKSDDTYHYIPNVNCSEYKSNTLAKTIQNALVTENDGVYQIDGGYYYRGKKVNNYVNLAGNIYMIIGVDSNNNVKLVDSNIDRDSIAWDNRFNTERNTSGTGMNVFDKSNLQEKLDEKYKSMNPNLKKYIVTNEWCVDARKENDKASEEVECNKTLKVKVGTFSAYEYVRASLEEQCTTALSGACSNYNYFSDRYDTSLWTITPVAEDSYEAYALSSGSLDINYVSRYYNVAKSFYINGNNIVSSGNGSIESPFIIK